MRNYNLNAILAKNDKLIASGPSLILIKMFRIFHFTITPLKDSYSWSLICMLVMVNFEPFS
jgi:hypothetical protein